MNIAAPQLSIAIVEYHCFEQIKECLHTLKAHLASLDWECIVVSNSVYKPEQLEDMRGHLPGVHVIANDCNRGYAGGVNRALVECRAPFILILNPDCRLTDDRVPDLIALMRQHSSIAMVGPKVTDERGAVQPSCRRFPRPWTFLLVRSTLRKLPVVARERQRYLMEDFGHTISHDVDWVSGGAMLLRKSALDTVGGMDERYFLYMEDVDWCRRFWRAGFRVTYVPCCTVIHPGRHESIRRHLYILPTQHTWLHLISLAKYCIKWRFKFHVQRVNNDTAA